MQNPFKKLFQTLRPSKEANLNYPKQVEFATEFVFELDGKSYWQVSGGMLNMPYRRGLAASDIYEEVEMRITKEYIQAHVKAVGEMLNDAKKFSIVKLVEFHKEIEQRLDWIVSPETIYKLASVLYFDETESPYEYNYKYNMEKIALWKKHNVADFFLLKPIKKLIPHLELSEQDLVMHIETTMKLERMQAESLLQVLSKANWTKDFYTILASQAATK